MKISRPWLVNCELELQFQLEQATKQILSRLHHCGQSRPASHILVKLIRGIPTMMVEPRAKRQREITTVEEFFMMAKDVQHQSGQKITANSMEDRRFREFFGVGVHFTIIIWTLLVGHSLLPVKVEVAIPHLLWAIYFLACYPAMEEGCATAADPDKGAINPKTWRKYI